MSEFSTGYKTLERDRDFEAQLGESDTLLQSESRSPAVWEKPKEAKTNGWVRQPMRNEEIQEPVKLLRFSCLDLDDERGPIDPEDVEQAPPTKTELPDWRRSAVLTIFIFPPTGLIAMILACLSQSSAKRGDMATARRLNCCSCWLVFISLLASLIFIMLIILMRLYGYVEDPF